MGIGLVRVVKMSGKRLLYLKRKPGKNAVSARVSPYIIEIINNPIMSYEHIHNICNMMVETELLAGVIRFVSVIMSIQKFTPK